MCRSRKELGARGLRTRKKDNAGQYLPLMAAWSHPGEATHPTSIVYLFLICRMCLYEDITLVLGYGRLTGLC